MSPRERADSRPTLYMTGNPAIANRRQISLREAILPVSVACLLTLFVQGCRRSLHKVDVVCTKFCTKKEESWQVNIDIKTASYKGDQTVNFLPRPHLPEKEDSWNANFPEACARHL